MFGKALRVRHNTEMITTGWYTLPDGRSNIKLKQQVTGKYMPECSSSYNRSGFSNEHQLCAGTRIGPLGCEGELTKVKI